MQDKHDKIIRAALYIRVSTEEQALHGDSLAAQEDEVKRFAEENHMKIVGIYRDEGNSARKPAMKRPVMLELLEDVKAGKVDRVLFTKLDRWFRNVREYHKIQEILEEHKVTWQATLESYDTSSADGRFKLNILLSVAEQEADRTSERIKFINQSKLRRKEARTGCVSYGYKVELIDGAKRVVKDPATEQYVQDFWDHYRKYESARLASIYVNQKHGLKRSYKAWLTTARSEMHTGTWYGVEDYCPAYISHKDWERLRENSIARSPATPARVYIFSGLLRCHACGNTLTSSSCRQQRKNGETTEYLSYRCHTYRRFLCDTKTNISEIKMERMLLAKLRPELEKFIITAEVKAKEKKESNSTMELAQLNEHLRRLNKIFMAGNIDDDEYVKETAKLKRRIEAAKEAEKDERPPDLDVLKQFLASDFETIYESLDPMDKRRMWRSIIEEVVIENHGIKSITFRA